MKKRIFQIDFLRTVALIAVVVVHTLQYNLSNSINLFFWNYLNFVVIAFVYCSAYVLELGYGNKLNNLVGVLSWWKKRLLRLIIPFYIYLFFHYLLWFLFPNLFNGFDLKNNFNYLKDSVLLIGGVSANWLPLLFIELALIFPLLKIIQKNTWLLVTYIFFCLIITGFYTCYTITGFSLFRYYRLLMVIPYSLVALLAMQLAHKETTKKYLLTSLLSFICFYLLIFIWPILGKTNMFSQKYPPNFYYFFYGLAMTGTTVLFSYLKIFQAKIIKKFILFSSTQVYNLFFASYIVNDFIQKQRQINLLMNNIFLQLSLVTILSYLVIYILKLLRR